MKLMSELFHIVSGSKLDFNKLSKCSFHEGGINFVGRSSKNLGSSGAVVPVPDLEPFEPGLITVALGGSKLLSAFIQPYPFYTAQNVAVLRPKKSMTFGQKLYLCLAIRHNRYRYSAFGREANRTLKTLVIPEVSEIPDWVSDQTVLTAQIGKAVTENTRIELFSKRWDDFKIEELFSIKKGKRLTKANMESGDTPFVGSTVFNNGITAYIGQPPIHEGNTISLSYDGSIGEAFYQQSPYWASDSVNVLYPKWEMTPYQGLFICVLLRKEKFRYNYGRKWHMERMKNTVIKLPVRDDGSPDWLFVEEYIKSLPYSSQI